MTTTGEDGGRFNQAGLKGDLMKGFKFVGRREVINGNGGLCAPKDA